MPSKKKTVANTSTVDDPEDNVRKNFIRKASEMSLSIEDEKRAVENFCIQLEGLRTFRHSQNKKLEEKCYKLREMERSMKSLEDKQKVEIDVLKHGIKDLLLEHQKALAMQQVQAESSIKVTNDSRLHQIDKMGQEKRALENLCAENELAQIELIKDMKAKHSNTCTEVRRKFERRSSEISTHFDARMKELKSFYEKRNAESLSLSKERFEGKVQTIMQECTQELSQIKMHFTTLIEENIDEEKVLKNKLTRLSKTEHSLERVFLYTKRIYESLSVPLEEAQNEIQKLRDEVKKHEIIKQVLHAKRSELKLIAKDLEELKWEIEVEFQDKEQQRLERLKTEQNARARRNLIFEASNND